MKHLTLLLCILTLAWCSLTTKSSEPITNSWSTTSWAITTEQTATWSDLMSGEDLTLSWSTVITGSSSGDIADGIAYIQDNNVRVRSGTQLIQLTKNWWRTDLCDNGESLEYLDPQINGDYLLMIVSCKDESSEIWIKDIYFGKSMKVWDDRIAYRSQEKQFKPSHIVGSNQKSYHNPLEPWIISIQWDGRNNWEQCYSIWETINIKRIIRSSISREQLQNQYCKDSFEQYKKANNKGEDYNPERANTPPHLLVKWYNGNRVIFTINCLWMFGWWNFLDNIYYIKDNKMVDPQIMYNWGSCIKDDIISWINSKYFKKQRWEEAIISTEEVILLNIKTDQKETYRIPKWRTTMMPSFYWAPWISISQSWISLDIWHYDNKEMKEYGENWGNFDLTSTQTTAISLN